MSQTPIQGTNPLSPTSSQDPDSETEISEDDAEIQVIAQEILDEETEVGEEPTLDGHIVTEGFDSEDAETTNNFVTTALDVGENPVAVQENEKVEEAAEEGEKSTLNLHSDEDKKKLEKGTEDPVEVSKEEKIEDSKEKIIKNEEAIHVDEKEEVRFSEEGIAQTKVESETEIPEVSQAPISDVRLVKLVTDSSFPSKTEAYVYQMLVLVDSIIFKAPEDQADQEKVQEKRSREEVANKKDDKLREIKKEASNDTSELLNLERSFVDSGLETRVQIAEWVQDNTEVYSDKIQTALEEHRAMTDDKREVNLQKLTTTLRMYRGQLTLLDKIISESRLGRKFGVEILKED